MFLVEQSACPVPHDIALFRKFAGCPKGICGLFIHFVHYVEPVCVVPSVCFGASQPVSLLHDLIELLFEIGECAQFHTSSPGLPRHLYLDLSQRMQRSISRFRLRALKLRVETATWNSGDHSRRQPSTHSRLRKEGHRSPRL